MKAATKKTTAKRTPKATQKAKVVKFAQKDPTKRKGVLEGQKAPPMDLPYEKLNENERVVLRVFKLDGPRGWYNIKTLAQWAFPVLHTQKPAKANSWVRNSLRRLVRGQWVEVPKGADRGNFILTIQGRKKLVALKPQKHNSKSSGDAVAKAS